MQSRSQEFALGSGVVSEVKTKKKVFTQNWFGFCAQKQVKTKKKVFTLALIDFCFQSHFQVQSQIRYILNANAIGEYFRF